MQYLQPCLAQVITKDTTKKTIFRPKMKKKTKKNTGCHRIEVFQCLLSNIQVGTPCIYFYLEKFVPKRPKKL